MPNSSRATRHRLLRLTVVLTLLVLPACHGWARAEPGRDPVSLAGPVRVRTVDGSRLVLSNLVARGDSVFGEDPACRWKRGLGRVPGRAWCSGVALARADISSVHRRVPAPYRTNVAILVFGLLWCALMVACLEIFSDARADNARLRGAGSARHRASETDERLRRRSAGNVEASS